MARLAGIELNDNWRVDYALTKIKGIGWSLSKKVLDSLKIAHSTRIKDVSVENLNKIGSEIEKYPIEGELLRKVRANIARLQAIISYRGLRHAKGLPVRGQRTKTNARTKRGKRKTVGAFKKEVLAKQKTAENAKK